MGIAELIGLLTIAVDHGYESVDLDTMWNEIGAGTFQELTGITINVSGGDFMKGGAHAK